MTRSDQALNLPRMRQVRDVMKCNVVTTVPEMTVGELIQIFIENSITGSPVVDSLGKTVGVVSITDVLTLAAATREAVPAASGVGQGPGAQSADREVFEVDMIDFAAAGTMARHSDLAEVCVRDLMTPVLYSIHPEESLPTAVRVMRQNRINRLLVMENGVLLGVITPFDVLDLLEQL